MSDTTKCLPSLSSLPYRYVQVVMSQLTTGQIVTLIGTTNSDNKYHEIDELILRHRMQIEKHLKGEVLFTSLTFMSSDGKMSSETILK